MCSKYWIGMRESEICYVKNFFIDSITVFGEEKPNNLIQPLNQFIKKNLDHNNEKNDEIITSWQREHINNILVKNPNAEFMFYNQIMALKYFKGNKNIICLNNEDLINKLDDKLYTREYYKTKVPCVPHFILYGKEISIEKLNSLFNKKTKYIVQSKNGSGGSGTLVFSNNSQKILLDDEKKYLVTEYYEKSISMNTHLMISKDSVLVLPSSIQIIENQYNHLIYKGCDFVGFNNIISDEVKSKVNKYAKIIGEDLQNQGYLGICGIDFIIYDNEVYYIEINSRFQNSSTILNKSLMENNQPSLQEMNYNCFKNKDIKYNPISVNYSSYILYYNEESTMIPSLTPIEILDESKYELEIEQLSYWKTNIYDKSIFRGK